MKEILQCAQLAIRYAESPTYMTTTVSPQSEVAFPAVTFCPENEAYKVDVLKVG